MRPLNDRERRTLRLGGAGIAIYLVVFFGLKAWTFASRQRAEYRRLQTEAASWNDKLTVYEEKARMARELMERFRFDPAQLARTSLVAQASAAIQQAAMQGGVQLGPVRETPSRGTGRELTGIQLEGMGPPPSILRFLESMGTLGFPLVTESVQITPPPMGAGPVKFSLTLSIPDYDQWKAAERKPDA